MGDKYKSIEETGDDLNKTENTQIAIATMSLAILSILIKNKIMGPSENVVITKCNGGEFNLIYDIDYGIYPIECTANNVDYVFDIVNNVIND